MRSIVSTFDNMKLTILPQAKRAETEPRQGTPTKEHLQTPDIRQMSGDYASGSFRRRRLHLWCPITMIIYCY